MKDIGLLSKETQKQNGILIDKANNKKADKYAEGKANEAITKAIAQATWMAIVTDIMTASR